MPTFESSADSKIIDVALLRLAACARPPSDADRCDSEGSIDATARRPPQRSGVRRSKERHGAAAIISEERLTPRACRRRQRVPGETEGRSVSVITRPVTGLGLPLAHDALLTGTAAGRPFWFHLIFTSSARLVANSDSP